MISKTKQSLEEEEKSIKRESIRNKSIFLVRMDAHKLRYSIFCTAMPSPTPKFPAIVHPILAAYPNVQAVYLYGTWGTADQRPDSDLDVAVLLPPEVARAVEPSAWHHLAAEVALAAKVERADLVNVLTAPVILRKEVVAADRCIYCAAENAAAEFEMLTLSMYQKFNEERRAIVESGLSSGRFYDV